MKGEESENTVAPWNRILLPWRVLSPCITCLSLLFFPYLLIVLQRSEHIRFGIFCGNRGGNVFTETICLKADLLSLIRFLLAEDRQDHIFTQPAISGKLTHLDCLRQRRRGILLRDCFHKLFLLADSEIGNLHSWSEGNASLIYEFQKTRDKIGKPNKAANLRSAFTT